MNICLRWDKVITRKTHWCLTCCNQIPKGNEAIYNVGVYDGQFSSCYICKPCNEYYAKHGRDYQEDGLYEGCFNEDPGYEEFKNNY